MNIGVVAEFDTPERLQAALEGLRGDGYRLLDAYTPYPVKALEQALGLGRSPLAKLIFPVGLFGAAFAFFLQWFLNAWLYPLNAGGRPPFAVPAFIIITFETMVLFSAVGVFVLFFWTCRMPWLDHSLFRVDGFDGATIDRFWLGVNAADEHFDPDATPSRLLALGALRVEFVGGRV